MIIFFHHNGITVWLGFVDDRSASIHIGLITESICVWYRECTKRMTFVGSSIEPLLWDLPRLNQAAQT
jgi:hypothetical protein